MALDLFLDSDNPVVIDRVTDPITGESAIADATVVVTLYASNKSSTIAGAVSLAAAWNSTLSAYVATIADTVSLTLGTLYYVKAVITRGANKRTVWMAAKGVDGTA